MKMASHKALVSRLGAVMQIAFVPEDFDAAVKFWTQTMGVGPFFYRDHVNYDAMLYHGAPTTADFGVAIAYWGDLQVELIRQHNDAPSVYRDWRAAGGEGLQHVCIVVDDMEEARRVCLEAGGVVAQEFDVMGGTALYIDTGGGPGTMLEMICFPPASMEGFKVMREAARTWDGSDPVRSMG
jgi:methylmalonyl-CoA/ethylmalonyl-CoA epimerase